ncbi:MAG: MFS transporter [Candidatus Thalassarchaeaceae archaeon]|nr:MFS transporter [Candidatus Thalassarchaeaceae archaeon]
MGFGTIEGMGDEENRALRSWYWYDWANQAFALTVLTVLVPQLLSSMFELSTGGGTEVGSLKITGDTFYAIILGSASLFVAIVSPVLGAIADRMPIKKKILWVYTVIGVLFTAMMGVAPHLEAGSAYRFLAFCLVIGNIGFAGGNVIYYAFMPNLADSGSMDHVSSWGYAYGFAGGSLILIVHLLVGLTGFFGVSDPWSPWVLSFIFVTSAMWWLGFGMQLFRNTPEPEIPNPKEYDSALEAVRDGISEVRKTFGEIRKFKILAIYLASYLLFFDGINTIGGMASAFGDSVLRLNPTMNFVLLLMVNITAVPMTVIGGKLANRFGTKRVLGWSLGVYSVVAILAVGFAPLELEDDHERYDFQYDFNDETGEYELTTLYDRGVKGWVSKSGDGDLDFRDSFFEYMFETVPDTSESERWSDDDVVIDSISMSQATSLRSEVAMMSEHRFSFSFEGGDLDGSRYVGEEHPTIIEGELADWWPNLLRDNVWEPLNFGVSLQWIMLGMMVGIVMGTAGAQARSLFTMLTPSSRSTEFFGFFGFIGKAAAVFGPIVYAISAATMGSRMAVASVVVVILIGWSLFIFIDVEEGIRVARQEDIEAGLIVE